MKIGAHTKILLAAILTLLFIPLLTNTASGDDSISEFKLTAGIDAAANDQFGNSVAISGDTAVVGAPNGESAYVYRFDGTDWEPLEKPLVAPTSPPTSISYFGWDVAIDGDTLVVSDFNFLRLYGSVYVFTRSGDSWDEGQELITGLGVGASVAIDGDTILVGAPFTGLTYVFTNGETGWEEKPEIVSPSTSMPFFGWAVDLSGDTAVVGAPLTGSAYAFTRNGDSWDKGQELITGSWVGSSVAIDGETVVVGAPSLLPVSSQVPQGPGSAYVFRKDAKGSWQQQELNPGVDGFGASVAISGDRFLVGAPTDDAACPDDPFCNSGSVQMFHYDGESWIQDPHHPALIPTLEPSPEESDKFGWAVAIDSSTVVAGAIFGDVFGDDPEPIDAGSASVFILPSPNQPPIAKAEAFPDEVKEGKTFTLDGSGSEDPDGDPLIYNWEQIDGPEVDLDLALVLAEKDKTNPAFQTFVAPEVSEGCYTITFELTVTEDVDGGLTSEPVTVDIRVLPDNKIYSELRRKRRHWFYWHKYTFEGVKDEVVTINFEPNSDGRYWGNRATLILKDKIRGVRFYKKDRSGLPNTITATLPADGKYAVYVIKHPWFRRGRSFGGDYILTLEGTCGKLRKSFGWRHRRF